MYLTNLDLDEVLESLDGLPTDVIILIQEGAESMKQMSCNIGRSAYEEQQEFLEKLRDF